ncbi:MAG: isoprenyl transferase [Gammaproteobacteria bacterium]
MEVDSTQTPRHVAIIMDGNGRWARSRHLPRSAGHKQGVEAAREVVKYCARSGVEVLTLFAFSSENWQRPKAEVSALMELFVSALRREVRELASNDVRVRFIGERAAFPQTLVRQIEAAERLTANCGGLQLVIAASYGGRWDISNAAREIAVEVAGGRLDPQDIDERKLASHLTTGSMVEPDLFIRTGGEKRISNFLLWQLAYTELVFTDVLWPDFGADALDDAFACFHGRQRRFGMTAEQIEANA